MDKTLEIIKELRLFIAIIISLGGTSIFNWDATISYIYAYNIHLVLIVSIIGYLTYFLNIKDHKKFEKSIVHQGESQLELHNKVKDIILENSIGQIKGEVRQAYKDYHKIEVIDYVTTIKYLRGLDERRIALGINSYTEDMMKELLKKTKGY